MTFAMRKVRGWPRSRHSKEALCGRLVEGMSEGGPKIPKLFGRHSSIARGVNMQHKRHVRDQ